MSSKAKTVDVASLVGNNTTPAEDGRRLAKYLLKEDLVYRKPALDVSGLPPEDIVSSFVNTFLYSLEEAGVDLARAAPFHWVTSYNSEKQRLDDLTSFYLHDREKELVTVK